MPLLTPGGFPGMAGLVDITKESCGLGASRFGEPYFPVLAIGIRAQAQGSCLHKSPSDSMLGVGLGRCGLVFQILICVKLIILPSLSSLNQQDADVCGWDPRCLARAKQCMD